MNGTIFRVGSNFKKEKAYIQQTEEKQEIVVKTNFFPYLIMLTVIAVISILFYAFK